MSNAFWDVARLFLLYLEDRILILHIPEDDSPYPEVRSAVANFDDPDMPCSTIRAWTLGLIWAVVLPGVNQFFNYRACTDCFMRFI